MGRRSMIFTFLAMNAKSVTASLTTSWDRKEGEGDRLVNCVYFSMPRRQRPAPTILLFNTVRYLWKGNG